MRRAKWEQITADDAIKGIYNFTPEIPPMRDYLDIMHNKHGFENPFAEPEGYSFPFLFFQDPNILNGNAELRLD